ncbi:hypothetical protein MTR_5g044620 [Medicago truncatula]|uniref:Uncharacterized protein n=1 Tax=Medicago truncatula TaxID=3880 RepID=G7JXZ3_MEDTR|nr:hypothetical protein MTR_5g044620 [Medicago truncatula]
MIGELGITQECVKIHCDSQSVIHLIVALKENPADVFTKSFPRSRFKHCLDLIKFDEE